jgi:hypothetical protein
VVTQPDRVGEALEADRVTIDAGDRQRSRDRADRDDELVIAQLLLGPVVVAPANPPPAITTFEAMRSVWRGRGCL